MGKRQAEPVPVCYWETLGSVHEDAILTHTMYLSIVADWVTGSGQVAGSVLRHLSFIHQFVVFVSNTGELCFNQNCSHLTLTVLSFSTL